VLIVICGLDGAGKTSLMRRLQRESRIPDAAFLYKEHRDMVQCVVRYHPRIHGGGRDWAEGPFAEAIGYASALDFLHHYRDVIRPALEASENVLCDRYSICYHAYLHSTGYRGPIEPIFRDVREPDLVVFADAPVEVAVARCESRGGAGEGENVEVMARMLCSYALLLEGYGDRVRRVPTAEDRDAAFARLVAVLRKERPGWLRQPPSS
jgi:thymidylate kinase